MNWNGNFRDWKLSDDGTYYTVTQDEPQFDLKKGDHAKVTCHGHGDFQVEKLCEFKFGEGYDYLALQRQLWEKKS